MGLMIVTLLWTALVFGAGFLAFRWLVESFGRDVAIVTAFALGGVVLAIALWVASSRHTTSIWRSALSYAADTEQMTVNALRSLSAVQREDARANRIREHGRMQIEVASYKAALTDARQEMRRERATPPVEQMHTWAVAGDDDDDFQWTR